MKDKRGIDEQAETVKGLEDELHVAKSQLKDKNLDIAKLKSELDEAHEQNAKLQKSKKEIAYELDLFISGGE